MTTRHVKPLLLLSGMTMCVASALLAACLIPGSHYLLLALLMLLLYAGCLLLGLSEPIRMPTALSTGPAVGLQVLYHAMQSGYLYAQVD